MTHEPYTLLSQAGLRALVAAIHYLEDWERVHTIIPDFYGEHAHTVTLEVDASPGTHQKGFCLLEVRDRNGKELWPDPARPACQKFLQITTRRGDLTPKQQEQALRFLLACNATNLLPLTSARYVLDRLPMLPMVYAERSMFCAWYRQLERTRSIPCEQGQVENLPPLEALFGKGSAE